MDRKQGGCLGVKYIHLFLMYARSFYTNKRSNQSTFVCEYRSDASHQLDWEWRSDQRLKIVGIGTSFLYRSDNENELYCAFHISVLMCMRCS